MVEGYPHTLHYQNSRLYISWRINTKCLPNTCLYQIPLCSFLTKPQSSTHSNIHHATADQGSFRCHCTAAPNAQSHSHDLPV